MEASIAFAPASGTDMTPPREVRASDISVNRLSFPMQMVIQIVAMMVSAMIGVLASTWGLRSDIEIIKVQLRGKTELDAATAKGTDDRLRRMEDDIRELKRDQKDSETRLRGEIRMKPYDDERAKKGTK